jgi:hypothetical protein
MTTADRLIEAAERAGKELVTLMDECPVVENVRGEIVWEGLVSVFRTESGRQVYAWADDEPSDSPYVAVLGNPPVESAVGAVRGWLKERRNKH